MCVWTPLAFNCAVKGFISHMKGSPPVTTIVLLYLTAFSTDFIYKITLTPPRKWKKAKFIKKTLQLFSVVFSVQNSVKTTENNFTKRFIPFSKKDKESILSEQSLLRNVLFLNRTNPRWGGEFRYTLTNQKNLLAGGFESKNIEEYETVLSDFLSDLYKEKTAEEDFNEMKFNKLKNRPLNSSVVIAIQMTPDPNGRIMEMEEIEAVACAVQNMHLTCTAYGIGGFWSTPKLVYTPEMNDFLKINSDDKCLGLFYMGYPEIEWPKGQRKPIEYITKWKK